MPKSMSFLRLHVSLLVPRFLHIINGRSFEIRLYMIPREDTLSPPPPPPNSLFVVPRKAFSASIRKSTICLSLFEESRFLHICFYYLRLLDILCSFSFSLFLFLYPLSPRASNITHMHCLAGGRGSGALYTRTHTQFLLFSSSLSYNSINSLFSSLYSSRLFL